MDAPYFISQIVRNLATFVRDMLPDGTYCVALEDLCENGETSTDPCLDAEFKRLALSLMSDIFASCFEEKKIKFGYTIQECQAIGR